jgi:hypothetical protein
VPWLVENNWAVARMERVDGWEEHLDEELQLRLKEVHRSLDPQEEDRDRNRTEEGNRYLQSLDHSIEDRTSSEGTALDDSHHLEERFHWEEVHCCFCPPPLDNWEEHPQQHGEACMDNCKARDSQGAFGDREAVRCPLLLFRNCIPLACHCCCLGEVGHCEEEAASSRSPCEICLLRRFCGILPWRICVGRHFFLLRAAADAAPNVDRASAGRGEGAATAFAELCPEHDDAVPWPQPLPWPPLWREEAVARAVAEAADDAARDSGDDGAVIGTAGTGWE